MPTFPQPGSVTICEINRDFITAETLTDDRAKETYGKVLGTVFTPIPFQKDHLLPDLDAEPAAPEQEQNARVPRTGFVALKEILSDSLRRVFFPNELNLQAEVDSQGVSWNPNKHIVAFISGPNQVTIRDYEDSEGKDPVILMSETQRDIKALEWRPNSGKTISVASKGGICIWSASYPGNAASVRSGVTSSLGTVSRSSGVRWVMIDFLQSPNGEQISALSFSLTFLHILGICFLSELIIHNMGYCSRERNSYSTWIRRHINAEVVTIWRLLFDCKIWWNILSVGDKYMDLRAVVFNRWMCYWSNLGSRRTYGTSWILKVYDIRFNPLLIKVSFIRCTSTTGGAARNCCFDGQPWDRKSSLGCFRRTAGIVLQRR
ncbi:aladin isoform X2 [Iris pallida]|uniref:Aladin isoform X2 n=1 Tax=Iris pallida TaxID=29817 RepID=A0AAX6ER56_IRIPA|nr:aladin isoform X2 [Iris pallida]